jgi:hypothetical protein
MAVGIKNIVIKEAMAKAVAQASALIPPLKGGSLAGRKL